jgi:chloramphenicol 3-O phosphotransferase
MNKIIILNGTSSSGKTSIANQLQIILEEPFFHINVDLILEMAPPKLKAIDPQKNDVASDGFYWVTHENDKGKYLECKTGEMGMKLVYAMFSFIKEVIRSNVNLIIDDVLFSEERLKSYFDLIDNNNKVYLVGIMCSLEELERRESIRKNRRSGEAKGQFESLHKDLSYDFIVDTTNETSQLCAQKIAAFIQTTDNPLSFRKLQANYGVR